MSRADEIRAERKERGSEALSGLRFRLPKIPAKAGWHRHYANDDATRIGVLMEQGYTIASDRNGSKADKTGVGTETSAFAGTQTNGAPMRAVLMEIPEEIYQEDQRAKHRAIDETEAGIISGKVSGADQSDQAAFDAHPVKGGMTIIREG
jgi:hypothetical protein